MKKYFRRMLAAVIAVCMAVTMVPVTNSQKAQAAIQLVEVTPTISNREVYEGVGTPIDVDLQLQGHVEPGKIMDTDIVLIFDVSGSMSDKIGSLKAAAKSFIDAVDMSYHRVGIVTFSDKTSRFAFSTDKDALKQQIDSMVASGGTYIGKGLDEALRVFSGKRQKVKTTSILLTDGETADQNGAARSARTAKSKIDVMYTIGCFTNEANATIPGNGEYKASEFLKTITASDAHYYLIGASKLMTTYSEISANIGMATAKNVKALTLLNKQFEIVPGSASGNIIQPALSSSSVSWTMREVTETTLDFDFQIKVKDNVSSGTYSIGKCELSYRDSDNSLKKYTYDLGTIEVKQYTPKITSISKDVFDIAGGEMVTLTGEHFYKKSLVYLGKSKMSRITVVDSNTITFKMPAHAQGSEELKVVNSGVESNAVNVSFQAQPEIKTISPKTGIYKGGTTVTISGKNFMTGAKVYFDGVEATVDKYFKSYIRVTTPFINKSGAVDVKVVNPDGTECEVTGGYTYQDPIKIKIISVYKNEGLNTKAQKVKVTVENVVYNSSFKVYLNNDEITIAAKEKKIKYFYMTIPKNYPAGVYDLKVENGDGTSDVMQAAYTVLAPPPGPAPVIKSLSKDSSTEGEKATVKVFVDNLSYGDNFKVFLNSTEMTIAKGDQKIKYFYIRIPENMPAGVYDLTVANNDGQSTTKAGAYKILGAPPAPPIVIKSVSPTVKEKGRAVSIRVYADNLQYGGSFMVTVGGTFVPVIEKIGYFWIKLDKDFAAGTHEILVYNGDGSAPVSAGTVICK